MSSLKGMEGSDGKKSDLPPGFEMGDQRRGEGWNKKTLGGGHEGPNKGGLDG